MRTPEREAEEWSRRQVRTYFRETHRILAFLVRCIFSFQR
jgi:hypothetical protein